MRLLTVFLILLCPTIAIAQPSAPANGPLAAADAGVPVLVSSAVLLAPEVAPVSVPTSGPSLPLVPVSAPPQPHNDMPGDDDVLGHGKEAIEAVKAARRAPTVAGVAAAIVAGIMFLIAMARRFGGLLMTSNQVRLFVVVAAALAGGLAQVSNGMGWTEVLFVALAPVVSVGMHQVFVKPVVKKKG